MRKCPKTYLGLLLKQFTKQYDLPRLFLVDCDFIIVWHAIWSKPSVSVRHDQTSLIINGVQITLVFDIYGSRASTKQTGHHIRAERCTWSDMQYVTITPQATFYANIYSKKTQRLVSKRMHNGGHLSRLGCSQQMPIDWFTAHITLQ